MFTLLNPFFLVGTLSAAIPIAIHLLHQKRARPVEWPSLRFLRTSQKRTAHRKRLQDLLLLLLRVGVLVFLSVALAKPFIRGAGALSAKAPTSAVIVLDNSYSMSCLHNGVPRFAAAKEAALRVLSALKPSDFVALIYSDGSTPESLARLSPGMQEAADAVRSAEPGALGGGLGTRIAEALAAVAAQDTPNREVYVITDMQRRGLAVDAETLRRAAGEGRKPVVSLIDCSESEYANCAVELLSLRAASPLVGEPVTIEAKVRNYSTRPMRRKVVLHAGGEAIAERAVELAGESVASVSFLHSFSSAGVHTGYVEIGEDSIAADNRRSFAVRIADRMDILVVEGRSSAIAEGRPAYYLTPAFLAARTGRLEAASALRPLTIPAEKLTATALADYDAVFLLGPPAMDGVTSRRLRDYVASGGGLVIAPGEGFDAEGLRRHLAQGDDPLLPATPGAVEGTSAGPVICRLAEIDPAHPVTRILKGLDRSALSGVMVRKRWRLEVEYGSAGQWLMKADDGTTLLAAGAYGRGRVFLLAVPPDASWSNLTKRGNVFVPLVRSMVFFAGHREEPSEGTLAGSPLPFDFPRRAGAVTLVVTDPAGTTTELRHPPAEGERGYPPATRPGIYEVEIRSAPVEKVAYAVNPDAAESDLTPMSEDDARKLLGGASSELFIASAAGGVDEVKDLISRIREGVKLWDAFLAMVLAAAVFECFFSNRVLPKGSADESGAPATARSGEGDGGADSGD